MSLLSAAAHDEDGDIIQALRAENDALKQQLMAATKSALDHVQRNRNLEALLEAVGAGGIGPLMQHHGEHQRNPSRENDLQRENGHLSTSSTTAPAGWKLVPVEPTEEMLSCIRDHVRDYPHWWEHSYRDLIKAAPQPPEQKPAIAAPAFNHVAQRKLDSLLSDGWAIGGYSICKLLPSSEVRHGFVTAGGLVGWWKQPHPMPDEAPQPPVVEQPQVEQEPCCESWSVNRIDDLGKIVDSSGRLISTVYGSQAEKIVACHNSYAKPKPQGEQKPAAWLFTVDGEEDPRLHLYEPLAANNVSGITPLYINPQPPRQPLTEKRIDELLVESAMVPLVPIYKTLARAVEREHEIGHRASPQQPDHRRLTDSDIDAIADAMPGGLQGFMKGWGWRQFARAVLDSAPQPKAYEHDAQEQCRTVLAAIEQLNAELGRVSEQRDELLEALKHIARMTHDGYAERHALEAIAAVSASRAAIAKVGGAS